MSKKSKYYISFGAGKNQLPLIQAAKSMGYHVIGVDQNIRAQGMRLCDIRMEESILNYRKIYKKILENILTFDIAGGFSASYGKAIASWSYIVERLNLYGVVRPLVEVLLDKLILRKSLARLNDKNKLFQQPRFTGFDPNVPLETIEEKIDYPIVMKPRNGYSKKNIFIANDKADLRKITSTTFFKKKRINPQNMMLESFIQGDEITVVGFVQAFSFHLIFLSNKLSAPHPPFVEIEHSFPSMHEHLKAGIISLHQSIVDQLQIPCSPVVSEWKYHQNKLHLIEFSPQIPGECMSDFLIPRSLNYPYFKNLIKLTTGEPIELPKWNQVSPGKLFRVRYWVQKPDQATWEQWRSRSEFHSVINENPHFPPNDNNDRYGVMGLVN